VVFDITAIDFPCDAYFPQITEQHLSDNREHLGVAMFGLIEHAIVVGVMDIEKELGFLLTKIFPFAFSSKLADPQ
jgi:hypothetical protein